MKALRLNLTHINELIEIKGYTRKHVAEKIDMGHKSFNHVMVGCAVCGRPYLSQAKTKALAKLLGVSLSDMYY